MYVWLEDFSVPDIEVLQRAESESIPGKPFISAALFSSGGQATFNEWTTADSQKDCSMANLQQDSAHSAGQKQRYKRFETI